MTDQEKYETALKALDAAQTILKQPRCIRCDYMMAGNRCEKFGEVPPEYLYTPTDCGEFIDEIPF